jgi:hypothetical protein
MGQPHTGAILLIEIAIAEEAMLIGCAVQKGHAVVVYGLDGHRLFSKTGRLYGYTGQAVAILTGKSNACQLYDAHGTHLTSIAGTTLSD